MAISVTATSSYEDLRLQTSESYNLQERPKLMSVWSLESLFQGTEKKSCYSRMDDSNDFTTRDKTYRLRALFVPAGL